jgi:enamine deaminase RidA (YjgF/YER057c/UK114 family)
LFVISCFRAFVIASALSLFEAPLMTDMLIRFLPVLRRRGAALLIIGVLPCSAAAQGSGPRHINPESLAKPTGYTHLVIAPDGRTVYIAGQVALDSMGRVVGEGNFAAQAEQVYQNLQRALKSVGGSMADLVKTTTFVTDIKNVPAIREVRTRHFARAQPPANTLIQVSGLARPEFLIEIEGVAVLRSIVRQ